MHAYYLKLEFKPFFDVINFCIYNIPYKQKFKRGFNFRTISEALLLAKIAYRLQYILLGFIVFYNTLIKNRQNHISLKFYTLFLG